MRKTLAVVCGLALSGALTFAATINYDDVTLPVGQGYQIPYGYAGLNWDNFWIFPQDAGWTGCGLAIGAVSPPNLVANGYYWYGTISAPLGTSFMLNSASLTACWWYEVGLHVEGYRGGVLVLDRTYDLTPTAPLLVDFGSAVVDAVKFTPGVDFTTDITQFVMDNLTINTPGHTVPWTGKGAGQWTVTSPGFLFSERGCASHTGRFTKTASFDPAAGITRIEITASNGEKLFGYVAGQSGAFPVIQLTTFIYGGTGRFEGTIGQLVDTFAIDETTLEFTATSNGDLSPVGADKN